MAGFWIPIDTTVPRDDKSIALGVKLGDDDAWRFVVRLWLEAAEYHPTGHIDGPHASEIVARRAGWKTDAESFVRAMVESKWLEKTPEGFYIHDWHKHTGKHLQQMAKGRRRVAKWRAGRTEQEPNANGTGSVRVRKANGTRVRGKREEIPSTQAPLVLTPLGSFLLATYPDIQDPAASEAAWAQAYPRVDLLAEALKAHAWETANPARAKKNHGAFLNRWFSNATPSPPPRTHGDLGSEIRPWPTKLTAEEKRQARSELTALHPALEDMPLGCPGDPTQHPVEQIAEFNARWRAVTETRQ